MRTVVVVVLAFILGALAGFVAMQMKAQKDLAPILAQRDAMRAEFEETRGELNDDIAKLRDRLKSLQTELANARSESADGPKPRGPAPAALVEPEDIPGEAPPGEPEPDDEEGRRGRSRDRFRPPNMTEEEWNQRRQEFEQMREQRRAERESFIDQAIANAPDVATQERIAAIRDYSTYMREMFDTMRNTEDEEEQQALRESMRQTFDEYRALVQEQQDQMLVDMAKEYGVSSSSQQEAFVEAYRQLQQSPFFSEYDRPGRGFGGPPGGGGGPGGGGR